MSSSDETPNPSPELPQPLEAPLADTLLVDRNVAAYCERRGLQVSEALRAFLRGRLGPLS